MYSLLQQKKIKVEIFIHEGACGCTYGHWIDQIWAILMKYKNDIDYFTDTSDSVRAKELEIIQGIVLNGKKVELVDLERSILKLLKSTK